jgi:hypothetical protein
MTKNNSNNLYTWRMFVKRVNKIIIKPLRKSLREFSIKYPNVSQIIQMSFIYFFAIVDLLYSVLSNVFSYEYTPEFIRPVYPFISWVLESSILQIWASPEKVFFLSYVVIEFMIVRKVFKFSKLVKYNVLLIFALLMIQGLAISYWDLLFNREVAAIAGQWCYQVPADEVIFFDTNLAVSFFLNTFVIFMVVYIYLFLTAIRGKFAAVPGMEWLTDSIAFWLQIKTPTMRFGKRKKKKDNETDS